nr:hypothetical protein [Mycobacterium pseudoshottsii]
MDPVTATLPVAPLSVHSGVVPLDGAAVGHAVLIGDGGNGGNVGTGTPGAGGSGGVLLGDEGLNGSP